MKKWKRLLAAFMAVALAITGLHFGGITSKATETTYTDMKISSFTNANTNSSSLEWRVNLGTSAVVPTSDTASSFFSGLTIETTLEGSSSPQVYRTGNNGLMLIMWGTRAADTKDGDTITVKAGSAVNTGDSSIGIHITQDFTLVYNGETSAWEIQVIYTEMPITGTNEPWFYNNSHWRVNLHTTATFPESGVYRGLEIEVNGEKLSNAYGYKNSTYLLLVMEGWTDGTLTDGTTITLKSGYGVSSNNSNVGIYIPNQYTIVYDADANDGAGGWVETVYTEMNISNYLNSNTGSGHWRVNLSTSTQLPTSDAASSFYSGLILELQDITASGPQVYRAGSNTMMLILWGSGTTATDGALITVKAGYALNTGDPTIGIHVTEDYTIEYDADTNTWSKYVHTDYSDITAEDLSSTSWYTEGGSQHWRLYAKVSGTFPSSDTATGFYTAPVYLNGEVTDTAGEKTSDAQVYKSGSTIGLLLWNYKVAHPEVGTTITVKAGEYKDKGDPTVGIRITEDINFKWDGSEWYFVVTPEETAQLALDTEYENGGNASNIYLTSTDNREVPSNSANITAVKSEEISGVFYNGEETTVYMRKFLKDDGESTGYWVLLGDAGIRAVSGDLVTIQGIFSYDNYAVEYEAITLLYDGTQWHTCQVVYPKYNGQGSLDFNTYNAAGSHVTDALDTTGWSGTYAFVQGGYYKAETGELVNSGIRKMAAGRYRDALPGSWSVGAKVVLDGIILDADKRVAVKFERTTWEKCYTDDTQSSTVWNIVENASYDKDFSLRVNTELSSVNEDTVTIILEASKGVLGEPEQAVWQDLVVTATDASGNVTTLGQLEMTKTDRGMLRITIDRAELPSGNCTIAVKIGLLSPVDTKLVTEETINPIHNIKDCYIYVNDYGVGYRQFVERTNSSDADETLTLVSGSTATTLKWAVASENTMTISSSRAFCPTNVDSGVFINGVRYEDISLKKTADTTISVNLGGYEIQNGAHVMIIGTFAYEEEFVEIAPVAVTYDGSSWSSVETTFVAKIALNIADDEYIVEGTTVTVEKDGTEIDDRVLYTAGNYTIVRQIGDVIINYELSLYRPNDINQNNKYDVVDLVKHLKYKNETYKAEMTATEQLAASEGTLAEARQYILGKTKADEALPVGMIGATNPGEGATSKYITSVGGTMNGTTVIGMSDTDNGYVPITDYDDYGFDYVIDYNVAEDRELKILQLSDTQIIDSAQKRYSGRLSATSTTAWATDQMDEILFDCIRETVKEANPDLILIAGDIIFGEFDDNGTSLQALVACMESFQIPWAPVWGNHDNESYMGVAWQNAQFADATYCLYYAGHEIGGNSNYSIGLAKNGVLQRSVYMMDSNFCANVKVYEDGTLTSEKHINNDGDVSNGEILTQLGFTEAQTEWYRSTALRTNEIAGKTIPSMLCYHVPTIDVWLATKAACYQQGAKDKNTIQYTLGEDITLVQSGDSGFKRGNMLSHNSYSYTAELLDIMNEVGGDGASFGHEHNCSISVTYGGVRWTFGLKTGNYDSSPKEQGGTLFTIRADGSSFDVTQIITQTVE